MDEHKHNGCGCEHHHHEEHCGCGHEHHRHEESCGCGRQHPHHEEHCGCGHEHHHHEESCGCGHQHPHHEEHCGCGHEHHHHDDSCGCGCGHDHGSGNRKTMLIRIAVCVALLIAAKLLDGNGWITLLLYLAAYLVMGWDVLLRAGRNILRGSVFDENFLMAVATLGAFAIGDYGEAVFVMLFYQVGELCQGYAVGRSRQSIAALMDIRPETVHLERGGEEVTLPPEEAQVGEVMVVHPSERIPLDGTVLEGVSTLDTAALTGESVPRDAAAGDSVISGCINRTGVLRIRVDRPYGESTVARILELVENAGEKKAKREAFITRFARVYTPCVVFASLALAVIPPLFVGEWSNWIHRALIFLVVSCPCALVLSVPLSFFGGIGGASRRGILVKGSCYLEQLAETGTVVLDKTGTLTEGKFSVAEVCPAEGVSREELLEWAARAEAYSEHPVALSLKAACPATAAVRVTDVQELAGHGVVATVDGRRIAAGNCRLMEREDVECPEISAAGTVVHVAVDGRYAGYLLIADRIRPEARELVSGLKACGVERIVMLTGDTEQVAASVAAELGIREYHAGLLPGDKVAHMERLLSGNTAGRLAFVGDGINDAPVLSRADVGIAMGALGSDAAIEAADVVLMDDGLGKIAEAVRISRKTLGIVRQNVAFALGVKALVLLLSALGRASMGAAVFADVGVALLTILNATRALRTK